MELTRNQADVCKALACGQLADDGVIFLGVVERKAGRADWGKNSKQTAGHNDLEFAAQVQLFMEQTGIQTLTDLEAFVGEQQKSLTQLDDLGKAIRKRQTALRHLEMFNRLKSVCDKSKQGLGFMQKQYAERHQQELNDIAVADRRTGEASGIARRTER